ncbi:uncharacterized protein B0I36DRAFT_295863 [Microdochium trichocladiopsis]|uniref:Trichothecene 3-O-acetyltransferase-like N-terminal domain-containing protein n=1 Tax=Microdochium trichocladiopsis TaxID=1682393 RepID=A0A9P8Y0P7_9PEZI|nr:uncharacterized protein B0I36DRAFT_295863 [Microdochium trichocladiopsis]KAH7025078.1 hypothetical protein B0I36DRAFT_295863 [Microdochium trichocladiopsis]
MPRVIEDRVRPLGWETFPAEQRFPLHTLDYLSTTCYIPHLFIFRLPGDKREHAATIFRRGLERTIARVPTLVGTIEKDGNGGHSIVVKRDSSALYVSQYLDGADDTYPSMDELDKGNFLAPILGDARLLSNYPMIVANIPEAHPDNSPPMVSLKINYIRGGLIITLATHHYWNSLSGMLSFNELLSANCRHEAYGTPLPTFDPVALDRTTIDRYALEQLPAPSEADMITAPPRSPGRNAAFRPSCSAMFHLPKSRGAQLKALATPEEGWISTYDAVCGLLWRVLSRLREPVYSPGWDSLPVWAQSVSFHRIFKNPPLPAQLQGNLHLDVNSLMPGFPALTLREVVHTAPLSRLATYMRHMTDGVDVKMLADELQRHRGVRNKADLSINVDLYPPLANLVSDWRAADYCSMDFGFGKPVAWRVLMGRVALSQICVYAPRHGPAGADEGMEVLLTVEKELLPRLLGDEEWTRFFEYRGLDAWEGERPSEVPERGQGAVKSKL